MNLGTALPALSANRRLRIFTLCALYFAQGVPWGFITITVVAILSAGGVSQQQTGLLVSMSILPWTFKLVWAPLIDAVRFPSLGLRRPWIVFAQAMMAVTVLSAVVIGDLTADSSIRVLIWVFFAHNCFASMQDVATDAMAIDLLDDGERGRANGLMWGSKLVGISSGGAVLATVIARSSLEVGMVCQVVVILLIMLLPLLLREREGEKLFPWSPGRAMAAAIEHRGQGTLGVFRELWRSISHRTALLGLIVAFVSLICEGLYIPVTAAAYTQVMGWSAETFSHNQGIWGTLGKLAGALVGGFLCDRLGRRRMAAGGAILSTTVFAAFGLTRSLWLAPWYPRPLFIALIEASIALTTVALFALFMKIAWTRAAATQFTLYMTAQNAGYALGPNFTRLGLEYTGAFLLCAALAALPLLLLAHMQPDQVVALRQAEGSMGEERLEPLTPDLRPEPEPG